MSTSTTTPEPADAINAVLNDFTEGAALRDLDRVRSALHAESRMFVPRPDGMQIIDRERFLDLMAAGKVGGAPTDRRMIHIEVDRSAATVRQIRDMGALVLHDTVSMVRAPEGWMIACLVVQMAPPVSA